MIRMMDIHMDRVMYFFLLTSKYDYPLLTLIYAVYTRLNNNMHHCDHSWSDAIRRRAIHVQKGTYSIKEYI